MKFNLRTHCRPRLQSAVKDAHGPANAEKGRHKTAKTVQAVPHTFAVSTLGNESENDACEQREQNRNFKMVEIDFHGVFRLVLLLRRNFVRIDHGEDVQESCGHQELGAVIRSVARDVRL
jgi:hypothetical protein